MQTEIQFEHQQDIDNPGESETNPLEESPDPDLTHRRFSSHADSIRTVEQLKNFICDNIDEVHERIRAMCYESADRSEEVVQELYPRMLRMLDSHPEGLNVPWAVVHTLSRRLAVDSYRRALLQQRFASLPDDDYLAGPNDASPEDSEHLELQLERLHHAMTSLNPRLRHIMTAIFFEQRPAKHVAAELELSEPRIAELKRMALQQLRMHMLEHRESVEAMEVGGIPYGHA